MREAVLLAAVALATLSGCRAAAPEGPPPLSSKPWVTLAELAAKPDLHVQIHQHVLFDFTKLPTSAEIAPRTYKVPLYLTDEHDLRLHLEETEPCFAEIALAHHDGTREFTIHVGNRVAMSHVRPGHMDLIVKVASPLPAHCSAGFMALLGKEPEAAPATPKGLSDPPFDIGPNLVRALAIRDPGNGLTLPKLGCGGIDVNCDFMLSLDTESGFTTGSPYTAPTNLVTFPIFGLPKFVPVGLGDPTWSHANLDVTNPRDQFAFSKGGSNVEFFVDAYDGGYSGSKMTPSRMLLIEPACIPLTPLPWGFSPESWWSCVSLDLAKMGMPAEALPFSSDPAHLSWAQPVRFGSVSFYDHTNPRYDFLIEQDFGLSQGVTLSPYTFANINLFKTHQDQELLIAIQNNTGTPGWGLLASEMYRMLDQCGGPPGCCSGTCASIAPLAGEIAVTGTSGGSQKTWFFNERYPIPFLASFPPGTMTFGPETTSAWCYTQALYQGDYHGAGTPGDCRSLKLFRAIDIVFSSDCKWCNLDDADLSNWNFDGRDFSWSTFRRANLTGSTLRKATLLGTVFDGANLTRTILDGAAWNGTQSTPSPLVVSGATFNGTSFRNAALVQLVFDGANTFTDAIFEGTVFSTVTFSGATMTRASFRGNRLTPLNPSFTGSLLVQVAFDNTTLDGMDFSAVTFSGCSFQGATMTRMNLTDARAVHQDFSGLDLFYSTMRGFRAPGASFIGTQMYGVDLSPSAAGTSASFAHGLLVDTNLVRANLSGTSFAGAILASSTPVTSCADSDNAHHTHGCASLLASTFLGTSFAGAYIDHVDLSDTLGPDPDFSGAWIIGSSFAGALYSHQGGDTGSPIDFANTFLFGTDLSPARLPGANFYQAYLDTTSCKTGTGGRVVAALGPSYFTQAGSPFAGKTICIQSAYTDCPYAFPTSDADTTCPDGDPGYCAPTQWTYPTAVLLPRVTSTVMSYSGSFPASPAACSQTITTAYWATPASSSIARPERRAP